MISKIMLSLRRRVVGSIQQLVMNSKPILQPATARELTLALISEYFRF
jgi:hypothetical protein